MSGNRPFATVQSVDQWQRSAHYGTALIDGIVQLAQDDLQEQTDDTADETSDAVLFSTPAGLAFDPWCRLFHSRPDDGQIDRLAWKSSGSDASIDPVPLFHETGGETRGGFLLSDAPPTVLNQPGSLATDRHGRLFIAEVGASRILVFDLVERRLARIVEFAGHPQIVDLCSTGEAVLVLLDRAPFLMVMDVGRGPRSLETELATRVEIDPSQPPSRLAFDPFSVGRRSSAHFDFDSVSLDQISLLFAARTPLAHVVPLATPAEPINVQYATDLEYGSSCGATDSGRELIVAGKPKHDFSRYCLDAKNIARIGDLRARNYDGRGIERTPTGDIGYWSPRGFRHALPAPSRYIPTGEVTTFRLDNDQFQTQWGRIFLDACIPADTDVRLHCVVSDETPPGAPLYRQMPDNVHSMEIERPDLSPPMPPADRVTDIEEWQPLHRRETGRELPWTDRTDNFETYEAPVISRPGRYLWVTLQLTGNTRRTPRIRGLRAEFASHALMRRLPRIYSQNPPAADFLRRFLAMFDGTLDGLDARASSRHALIDPTATPSEALPWLASLMGLTLDRRWNEQTRRTIIAEAIELFQYRGTIRGLRRLLEIYLGFQVNIVEAYRFRGLGGARVGAPADSRQATIVGNFRVGGKTATQTEATTADPEDAFETHAHRFSVVIPARLSQEQHDVVHHILDQHRPAHTLYDICTVDSGIQVGNGAHLELTTVVGHSDEFGTLQTDHSLLGRIDVIGHPQAGSRAGLSQLGKDSVMGAAERTIVPQSGADRSDPWPPCRDSD